MSLDAPIVSALRAIASGVTPAHDMGATVASAMDAIATAACTDSHSTKLSDTFTVHALRICPADDGGRIYWEDPHSSSSTPHTANAAPALDMLLRRETHGRAIDGPVEWTSVPQTSGGSSFVPRRVATSHYLSESDVACDGAWPHVFRVHHYCLSPMRDDADVRLHPRPAPRAKAIDATAAGGGDSSCLHELFVEVPALCRVPPFGDEAPRRLERLLDEVYANRSGYVASAQHDFPDPIPPGDAKPDDAARMVRDGGGGEDAASAVASFLQRRRALTYGELAPEGILQLVDVFDELARKRPLHGGARTTAATAAGFGAGDTVVDVGSGVGKVVVAMAMLTGARAVGIELNAERALIADGALDDAVARGLLSADEASRVQLRRGDATRDAVLPSGTTFVYMSNLCFSAADNARLRATLQHLPQLRCVAALKELDGGRPLPPAGAAGAAGGAAAAAERDGVGGDGEQGGAAAASCRLDYVRQLRVRMTWDDHSRLHIYCCNEAAFRELDALGDAPEPNDDDLEWAHAAAAEAAEAASM